MIKPLERDTEYHFTTGYPGPLTAAADEVSQLARFCTDRMDLEQTIEWGNDRIKGIYSKFV